MNGGSRRYRAEIVPQDPEWLGRRAPVSESLDETYPDIENPFQVLAYALRQSTTRLTPPPVPIPERILCRLRGSYSKGFRDELWKFQNVVIRRDSCVTVMARFRRFQGLLGPSRARRVLSTLKGNDPKVLTRSLPKNILSAEDEKELLASALYFWRDLEFLSSSHLRNPVPPGRITCEEAFHTMLIIAARVRLPQNQQ